MRKKRYKDAVEMVRDLTEDQAFADSLREYLARRTLVTELCARRAACGLTQTDVAEKMGCTQGRISRVESSTDGDLDLSTLVAYADAIGLSIEITLVGKDVTAVNRVKHHAFCIKRLTDYLAHLAVTDAAIAEGVSRFFNEATFNLLHMLQGSAKKLPPPEEPRPALTVKTLGVDDCAEEKKAPTEPKPRRRYAKTADR
jgi:transcriptional regulator with XRE-family HTH domain